MVNTLTNLKDLQIPEINYSELDCTSTSYPEAVSSMLAEARAQHWLASTPIGITVIRHKEQKAIVKDRRFRTPGVDLFAPHGITEGVVYDFFAEQITSLDGEQHARLRRLIMGAINPNSIARFRPLMRNYIREKVTAVINRGYCDIFADIIDTYPIAMFCELLGAPKSYQKIMTPLAPAILKVISSDPSPHMSEIESAVIELYEHAEALIKLKRQQPGDDLLSDLISVLEDGDRLTNKELRMIVATTLLGGTDTARAHIANGVSLFLKHPDQWKLIQTKPDLIPQAIDEILRFLPCPISNFRVAKEDVELNGVRIPSGTMLALDMVAGNRDPAAFEDPDRFDITRRRSQQMTFGGGLHYCLGQALARAEMEEAFSILSQYWKEIETEGEVCWPVRSEVGAYEPTKLHVRFRPNLGKVQRN